MVTALQCFKYVRHRVPHWVFKVRGWRRAGLKLEAALDAWALDVRSLRCLDAGVSTGGFTDCLLQRGAAHVVGVDVGYGQVWTQKCHDTAWNKHRAAALSPADAVGASWGCARTSACCA